MSIELHLEPELQSVVDECRRLAESMGELPVESSGPLLAAFPPDVAEVIRQWIDAGGYDEAVARIAAEDPELADQ